DFLNSATFKHELQQILKLTRLRKVPAPATQINSREHNLAVSGALQRLNLPQNFISVQRSALAADKGNHAKRAPIIASVLNLQIRTRPACVIARFKYRRGQELRMSEDVPDQHTIARESVQRNKCCVCDMTSHLGHMLLMRIANHSRDTGKCGQLFRRALRVASRDQDLRRGI